MSKIIYGGVEFENEGNYNLIDLINSQLDTFNNKLDEEMNRVVMIPENLEKLIKIISRLKAEKAKEEKRLILLQMQWNRGLERYSKAEEVAKEKPDIFYKYINNFHQVCQGMSSIMEWHRVITGSKIPDEAFDRGFVIDSKGVDGIDEIITCEAIESSTEEIQEGAQHE